MVLYKAHDLMSGNVWIPCPDIQLKCIKTNEYDVDAGRCLPCGCGQQLPRQSCGPMEQCHTEQWLSKERGTKRLNKCLQI